MEHFISMYIDNELSLDEKILFLEQASGNRPYTDEAVALIKQEKLLSAALTHQAPEIVLPASPSTSFLPFSMQSLGWVMAACLVLFFSFSLMYDFVPWQQNVEYQVTVSQPVLPHRFIIQQHDSSLVEISGSFTNWQPRPLAPTGTDGYWEIYLDLPAGEHRYTFIIDGSKYLPDPTVPARETDDFGSTNSILKIEV